MIDFFTYLMYNEKNGGFYDVKAFFISRYRNACVKRRYFNSVPQNCEKLC